MGRKKAEYDPEVLNRVRLAWHAHKDKTGMSQSSAAEMLNMNQSAFSQYLRGTVSLNDVFLSKFSMLIGKDPSYFDDRLSKFAYRKESIKETGIVHIEYALSGVRYNPPKTLVVASPYVPTDRVPILVDTANFKYKEGMLMVCSTNTQSLKETQEVALAVHYKRGLVDIAFNALLTPSLSLLGPLELLLWNVIFVIAHVLNK